MPSVVTRWHGVPAQNFCRARKIALAVACGAFAPSSVVVIVPQLVTRVSFHALPWARDFGGGVLKVAGFAGGFTVGAGHRLAADAADAAGDAEGDADGAAAGDVLPDRPVSATTPSTMAMTATTVPPATAAFRRTLRRSSSRCACLAAHFSYRRRAYSRSRSRLLGDTRPPHRTRRCAARRPGRGPV